MLKITKAKTTYLLKPEWKDYAETERVLGVKKSVLDCLQEFAELNEETDYEIYSNNELLEKFSVNDYRKGNIKLSFFNAGKQVERFEIETDEVNTGKTISYQDDDGKQKERKEVIIKHRLVIIHF